MSMLTSTLTSTLTNILFEFDLRTNSVYPSIINTYTVFSDEAQKLLHEHQDDISLASEITGCMNEYAHSIFIITRTNGRKMWYYKHISAPLEEEDWWTSKHRDDLAKDSYLLIKITDVNSDPPKNLYPDGWPEDLIDPLAITV
jgi:hypothetical protein